MYFLLLTYKTEEGLPFQFYTIYTLFVHELFPGLELILFFILFVVFFFKTD